jgi:hypothetical protein
VATLLGREENPSEKNEPTGGLHSSARKGDELATVSGMSKWAAGWFLIWAERSPWGPFSIFIFFSSFLFLIFLFLL